VSQEILYPRISAITCHTAKRYAIDDMGQHPHSLIQLASHTNTIPRHHSDRPVQRLWYIASSKPLHRLRAQRGIGHPGQVYGQPGCNTLLVSTAVLHMGRRFQPTPPLVGRTPKSPPLHRKEREASPAPTRPLGKTRNANGPSKRHPHPAHILYWEPHQGGQCILLGITPRRIHQMRHRARFTPTSN
jgi:hypothetical protein